VLRHPLHGEFLALLGAVEKIRIEQVLVRKAPWRGARREERFLAARADAFAGANAEEKSRPAPFEMTVGGVARVESDGGSAVGPCATSPISW